MPDSSHKRKRFFFNILGQTKNGAGGNGAQGSSSIIPWDRKVVVLDGVNAENHDFISAEQESKYQSQSSCSAQPYKLLRQYLQASHPDCT